MKCVHVHKRPHTTHVATLSTMLSFVLSIRSLVILRRHFYLLLYFTLNNHKYFMSFECDPSHCNWMLFTAWMMMMLSMLKNTHMMLSLSVFLRPTYHLSNFHRGNSILTIHTRAWISHTVSFNHAAYCHSVYLFVCLFSEKLSLLPKLNIYIQDNANEWANEQNT